MFMDDIHSNLFENMVKGGENRLANFVAIECFITKMVRFAKTLVTQRRLFVIYFKSRRIPPISAHRPQNKCLWMIFTPIFSKTS